MALWRVTRVPTQQFRLRNHDNLGFRFLFHYVEDSFSLVSGQNSRKKKKTQLHTDLLVGDTQHVKTIIVGLLQSNKGIDTSHIVYIELDNRTY